MARKQGQIIKHWLDDHGWLIDKVLSHWQGNISNTAYDLSNSLRRDGEHVKAVTLRSQLSRWLKRREQLLGLAKLNGIDIDLDYTAVIELLQAKQADGKLMGEKEFTTVGK
ncbi:hypothetical protein C9J03_25910 [Photobacterium gaetbulicola]|uniref:hypothetical protein n=1 Tax=Photobacterium gaetbulicola TaxID=1295392 RepID=UPI0005CC5BE2|nr:hypothetical protein [Photobacterium gaetbulicola]PST99181.1 hypothetical protein C9J03_25910 [Photobacterium gaetbulicola]